MTAKLGIPSVKTLAESWDHDFQDTRSAAQDFGFLSCGVVFVIDLLCYRYRDSTREVEPVCELLPPSPLIRLELSGKLGAYTAMYNDSADCA
jgi:hypothetical protein